MNINIEESKLLAELTGQIKKNLQEIEPQLQTIERLNLENVYDERLYRDEDGTLHFDIKCYDGSPQLTMHDVTPDEFFAYVEVHDTTREEVARLPLVELKRKHTRAVDESLRLGEYLFCSEDRTAYDKAHARLMKLICNGCADTAERWRLEEENAPRRKRIVDAEIKYSCLQYKIGKQVRGRNRRTRKSRCKAAGAP